MPYFSTEFVNPFYISDLIQAFHKRKILIQHLFVKTDILENSEYTVGKILMCNCIKFGNYLKPTIIINEISHTIVLNSDYNHLEEIHQKNKEYLKHISKTALVGLKNNLIKDYNNMLNGLLHDKKVVILINALHSYPDVILCYVDIIKELFIGIENLVFMISCDKREFYSYLHDNKIMQYYQDNLI